MVHPAPPSAETLPKTPPEPSPSPPPSGRSRWRPSGLDALTTAVASVGPLAAVLMLLAVAAALWLAWRVLQPTPDKQIVIATGPAQGAYGEFAKRYAPLLQAQGLTVTLRATQGSAENLALLRDPASGVQAAFVQGGMDALLGAQSADEPGSSSLRSLGSVAIEPLWLFYRTDRVSKLPGGKLPATLGGLAAWQIDTGPAGGGSGPLFEQLAQAGGLINNAQVDTPNGISGSTPGSTPGGSPRSNTATAASTTVNGVVELVSGRIDALALVSAAEAPLVQYLLSTPGVAVFDFAQAQAYERRYPFLRALVLPRGVADLALDLPPQDVQLVASTALLAVRADLHPALAQLLLQAAHQVHAQSGWFNRQGEFPQPGTDGMPLSAEADHYYRNGPPWLQRYLPFWLANFVDRMWVVLLPLLAALLPLSRVLPPLVTLRLRSRVYRWYANLRAIEQALDKPGADLPALQAELQALDVQTEHIGLPLSFTNELYDLRAHINLVRKRLQAKLALADSRPSQPAAS